MDEYTPEPMPDFLRKWILEQFKAIDLGELDGERTRLFLEFVEKRQDSHYIQELFNQHLENMNKAVDEGILERI